MTWIYLWNTNLLHPHRNTLVIHDRKYTGKFTIIETLWYEENLSEYQIRKKGQNEIK